MTRKLDVDCYRPGNCKLENNIDPRDKECQLDSGKLIQVLEKLAIELEISSNVIVYLCRCDKPQEGSALPPCGQRYLPGSFDIFLLIMDKEGRRMCIWVECKVGKNIRSIVSRFAERFNDYHAVGNKVSNACCNRGPHASVLLARVGNVDELKKMLEERGLGNVLVVDI